MTADEQSRLIEGVFSTESGAIRVCCIYLPNGNPVKTDKFTYKLGWMDRLIDFVEGRLALEEPFVLLGDFNIIPAPIDATFPDKWVGDALFRPESAAALAARCINLGLVDAQRAVSDEPNYTFWDFKTFGWDRQDGIRIDHLLLSPQAADRLSDVFVHREVRGWDKPSDHVPVEGTFYVLAVQATGSCACSASAWVVACLRWSGLATDMSALSRSSIQCASTVSTATAIGDRQPHQPLDGIGLHLARRH